MENTDESESDSEIKRKVRQKGRCNSYQSDLSLSSATKKCLTQSKVGYILKICKLLLNFKSCCIF